MTSFRARVGFGGQELVEGLHQPTNIHWLLWRGRQHRAAWWQPQPVLRDETGCISVPSWEFPGMSATSAVSNQVACSLCS